MWIQSLALAALPLTGGGEVTWFDGAREAAIEAAKEEGRYLLTYFWANTENCQRLYAETMQAEPVVEIMAEMVCFSANAGEDGGRAILDSYGLTTVPALLVTGPNGEDEEMLTGFMSAGAFVAEMNRIRNGVNTISDLRERAGKRYKVRDEDYAVRKMLADKLETLGRKDESAAILAELREKDRKVTTQVVAEMYFSEMVEQLYEEQGEDLSLWDFEPLEAHVAKLPKKNQKGATTASSGWAACTSRRACTGTPCAPTRPRGRAGRRTTTRWGTATASWATCSTSVKSCRARRRPSPGRSRAISSP